MRLRFFHSAMVLAFICLATLAKSATINSNAVTGNWLSGSSWVGGVVPGINDIAVIVSGANITINGNISISSVQVNTGGTLNAGSATITLNEDWTVNGTFNRGTSTVIFNGTGAQTLNGTSPVNFQNIIINNTNGATGMGVTTHPVNTIIYGNIQNNGVFNRNSTSFPNVKITFAGNTTVSGVNALIMHNVDILSGATVNGATGISGGTSDMFFTGNWNNQGTFNPGTGTVHVQYSSSYTTQTISGTSPFYNLRLNKNVIAAPQNNLIVQNDFTILLGTWNASGFSLNVAGDFTNMATFNAGTGTVELDGTTNQNVATNGSAFYNYRIDKPSGTVLQSSDVEVTNNLNLVSGVNYTFQTTATLFEIYISNNNISAISGGSSSSHIVGNLRRAVAAGASVYSFPIGVMNVSAKYRPVIYDQTNSNGASSVTMSEDTVSSSAPKTANWYLKLTSNANPSGQMVMNYDLATDFTPTVPECILAVIRGQASPGANWNHVLPTVTSASGGSAGSIRAVLPSTLSPNGFIIGEPLPVASGASICSGSTATLSATFPTGSSHFNWYDSPSGGTLLATDSSLFVSGILNSSTTFYVEYFDSLTSCTAPRVPVSVTVTQGPSSQFTLPDTICLGSIATVTFQGTNSPTGTYYWNFDGGIVMSGSGAANHQVYWNTAGVKNVTLNISDNPCSSPVTIDSVLVVPSPSPATISTSSFAVCQGDTVILNASGSVGGNITYTFFDSIPTNAALGQPPVIVQPFDTSTYYLSVSNEYGCTLPMDSVTIFTYPLPNASSPYSSDPMVCYGDSTTIYIDLTTPPAANVYWYDSPTGGGLYGAGTSMNTSDIYGPTTYYAEAVTVYGCTNGGRIPVTVQVPPLPSVTISSTALDNTIYVGEPVTITAEPAGYDSYLFFINSIEVQSGPSNTFYSEGLADNDIIFVVPINDSCRGWVNDSIVMNVLPIANAFTPNGDGINDVFLKRLDLTIVNRWGQELYKGTEGWDGTYNGQKVSAGTYYYIYRVKESSGEEKVFNGPVTVVLD